MDEVKPVHSKADWQAFIELPWQLYRDDPHWVPPLRQTVRDILDERKNPFFLHAEKHALLALRHGRPVGRIVGIIDRYYNAFHRDLFCQFGFFECIPDAAVARLLLDGVADWARANGMARILGPLSPSITYEVGVLVDGFDDDPYVMTAYNPPYYAEFFESWGLQTVRNLYAYEFGRDVEMSERIQRLADRRRQRASITFRNVHTDGRFRDDVREILQIYSMAWHDNWGFAPIDFDEFYELAKEMMRLTIPEFVIIVQVKGEFAGFALAVPDVNQAVKKLGNGKLWPFGLLRLLWHLKGPFKQRTVNRVRLIALGIKPEFQHLGLGPILYTEYYQRLIATDYVACELSWVLEENPASESLKMAGAKQTKVYRLYQGDLAPALTNTGSRVSKTPRLDTA